MVREELGDQCEKDWVGFFVGFPEFCLRHVRSSATDIGYVR